ncbi:MAG: isoprenyl transferase [Myxococcota bacterium]|nr:isoprenyl transferase [Myxococcota bacterium]
MSNEAIPSDRIPRHVAIIMDGNGRWAEARGLERNEGHRAGIEAVRAVVETANDLGIGYLTLYAFSNENWGRPQDEVRELMRLLEHYLVDELDEVMEKGIRIRAMGRLDRLPAKVRQLVLDAVERSVNNDAMTLVFALSYSGRGEIVDAARRIARDAAAGDLDSHGIDEKTFASYLYEPEVPDPDLLIRTGAESRISNFLLWQLAYTEIYTTEVMWPDFVGEDLVAAVQDYQSRERRFGKTSAQVLEEEEGPPA